MIHCKPGQNPHIKRVTWTPQGEEPSSSSNGEKCSNRDLDVFPSRYSDILICIGMVIVPAERQEETRGVKTGSGLENRHIQG